MPVRTENTSTSTLVDRLREREPLVTVELRPPRNDMSSADSMSVWIDMYHSIRRLAEQTYLFLTDNAVGASEEENLGHLAANLAGDILPSRVSPFLTCKHTLDYCRMYAKRAASQGYEALTVLGGDRSVGAPRCVPHAYELRRILREQVPGLELGGWANPHRDPTEQLDFITDDNFTASFVLTQVVSHHSLRQVEAFLQEMRRRDVQCPVVFGVFCYRSAKPATLTRLGEFFPVPAAELAREFDAGHTAEMICARSIKALRDIGADKVYLSNLGIRGVERRYARIVEALDGSDG